MEREVVFEKKFLISAPPHIHRGDSVAAIMKWVLIAMSPAAIGAVYFFGWRAFFHLVIAVSSCVGSEALFKKLTRTDTTIRDLSAVVTGILLAFSMPPAAPYWLSFVGGVFAMVVVKQAFGGLGHNFMNPALASRAFLLAAWPGAMTTAWILPRGGATLSGFKNMSLDAMASATPLHALKDFVNTGLLERVHLQEALQPLLLGNIGGCIGETSALALLLGGAILLIKKIIDFRTPLVYLVTVLVLTWFFNKSGTFFTLQAVTVSVFHLLSGGLLLGAFFMCSDPVTTPITPTGKILFGFGCGSITVIIRLAGGYPEGVAYAIILMNIASPLLDRIHYPRVFGERK
jgi:electron transport complex protein RnfD